MQRQACELASAWAARGRDVVLITPGSRADDYFTPHEDVLRVAVGAEASLGDRVLAAGGPAGGVRALGRALRRSFGELAADVAIVFADGSGLGAAAAGAARKLRVPSVVVAAADPAAEPPGGYLKALRLAHFVVTPTDRVAAALLRATDRQLRTETIPPVIPQSCLYSSAAAASGLNRVLAVGSLTPHNGFDLLLRAIARIRTDLPDWSLRILGHGPEHARLLSLTEELELGQAVEIEDAPDDLAGEYRSARVFALPSRREVFAVSLIEAMAAGLAVVAFDCPTGPREIIGHRSSGLLVPFGKTELFAEQLARLMTSPKLRNHLCGRARQAVAGSFPDPVMRRWEQLLGKLTTAATTR